MRVSGECVAAAPVRAAADSPLPCPGRGPSSGHFSDDPSSIRKIIKYKVNIILCNCKKSMTLANVPRYDSEALSEVDERAVVVGGSIAGLLAARVLADRFAEVTVVERDPVSDDVTARRGVPQTSHVHP